MNHKTRIFHLLRNETITFSEIFFAIIHYIRPRKSTHTKEAENNIEQLIEWIKSDSSVQHQLGEAFFEWLSKSKLSLSLIRNGIVSKNGFKEELSERLYNKFLPPPPKSDNIDELISYAFTQKEDALWVSNVPDEKWKRLFDLLYPENRTHEGMKLLLDESLYAMEILSVWIASEEFDNDFLRLDETSTSHDSPFVALHREIGVSIDSIRHMEEREGKYTYDPSHIEVLIDQCIWRIAMLKKKSVNQGISVSLTYKFERIEQILERIQTLSKLIQALERSDYADTLIDMFKKALFDTTSRNSIGGMVSQNFKILARSVTNNASDHGEHYITSDSRGYLKMLLSASGAGVVIALMALNKMWIGSLGLTHFVQDLLSGFNYGLGFVFIHILGFTIATKQPAMTASTIASVIEKGSNNKANQSKLVELFAQVSRSQFAAVIGNVTLALGVAYMIGYLYTLSGTSVLTPPKTAHYLADLTPFAPLFYAAVAGFWLFLSGLIAGYFDNRANYLNLEQRYYHHPVFKPFLPNNMRHRFSHYLHHNHGAFMGNFLFGMLLGMTPFLGYIFQIDLDIRHIAFSSANLGYCAASTSLTMIDFLIYLCFVLMIGMVNLGVSFTLALIVALKARGAYFGNPLAFAVLLVRRFGVAPRDFFFPSSRSDTTSTLK